MCRLGIFHAYLGRASLSAVVLCCCPRRGGVSVVSSRSSSPSWWRRLESCLWDDDGWSGVSCVGGDGNTLLVGLLRFIGGDGDDLDGEFVPSCIAGVAWFGSRKREEENVDLNHLLRRAWGRRVPFLSIRFGGHGGAVSRHQKISMFGFGSQPKIPNGNC